MADTLTAGPSANTLDPRVGNDKRKALLQMLMAQHGAGGAASSEALGSGAPGGISFLGGIRAIPHNRPGINDTGFTHPTQVASQFLGGMGVGARPQPSGGGVVAQFLPSPGGGGGGASSAAPNPADASPAGAPLGSRVAPPAPAPAGPMSPAPAAIAPLGPSPAVQQANAVNGAGSGTTRSIFNGDVHTPTAAPPGMIALGHGAFYNPATQQVHYAYSGAVAQ